MGDDTAANPKRRAEEAWLDVTGDGGVLKRILESGEGVGGPFSGSMVTVHYVGTLTETGAKFDRWVLP
jgi:FKBP-type peptidyl-prolyl cis-trans isomerase